jgi:hypothetical protein
VKVSVNPDGLLSFPDPAPSSERPIPVEIFTPASVVSEILTEKEACWLPAKVPSAAASVSFVNTPFLV